MIANLQETELAAIQRRRDKKVLFVAKTSFGTMYDRLGERWAPHRPTAFDNASSNVPNGSYHSVFNGPAF